MVMEDVGGLSVIIGNWFYFLQNQKGPSGPFLLKKTIKMQDVGRALAGAESSKVIGF